MNTQGDKATVARQEVEQRVGPRPNPLQDLAEWLVSLDEPDSTERRTVTLNQIIYRARRALDGEG